MNIATTQGRPATHSLPEHADLRPDRRGAGGGRLLLCAVDPGSSRCGCAGWRSPSSSPPASPTISTATTRAIWNQQSTFGRMLDPIADKLLVASCLLMLAADRHHRRLVAVGRHHHPVPRDPGLGPARISRGAEGQRAGDAAREVEDHDPDGRDRLPDRRPGRRARSCPATTLIGIVLLWISAILTHLHRLRLFPRRHQSPHRGG